MFGRGSSSAAPTVPLTYGEKLCDVVYLVHNPEGPPKVEIIFIHGLQLSDSKDAYWRTWLAKDGSQDNFWPSTWLSEMFPHSRILSLSYDASAMETTTSGRMDMYALGESLLPQMLLPKVRIGQHNCPIMFVCHSLGGLVAKQIVVTASRRSEGSEEIQNFLMNLKAFFFYATPHGGSKLADLGAWIPFVKKGPLLKHLKVLSTENSRLSSAFDKIQRQVYNNELIFSVVAETHMTSYGHVWFGNCFHSMVVEESSARYHGYDFLPIGANHFDVCKPTSKDNSSFQRLTQCISNVIQYQEDKLKLVSLPDYLVGMDDMRDIVCKKLQGVSIVGIVGMGGIGKTTLSKTVFISQIQSVPGYEKTCFLQDVKSKESARSIESIQKQLLKDLCGLDLGSSHIVDESHLKRIRQCIQTRKVLVVIDDVDKTTTLDALQVPAFGIGNNSESKVILTTRNWQALQEHVSLEGKIDMAFLNPSQAEELFCHYAFKLDNTDTEDMRSDFKNLAKEGAEACCGLPLSVEVIGRYLGKKNALPAEVRKEIWHEALKRLHEAIPLGGGDDNEILWKRLRISYDHLNDPEKSMFLDFACLFCNIFEHFDEPSDVLSDLSIGWIWNSRIGMQNLIDRSLIKFDKSLKGRLTMHDQLRDMGRRIVKELSMQKMPVKPIEGLLLRNMTRLWEGEKILSFLNESKSSTSIQGISLNLDDVFFFSRVESSSFKALEVPQPHTHRGKKQKIANHRFSHLRLLHLQSSGPKVVKYFIGKCWTNLHWLCLDWTNITSFHIEAIGLCTSLRVLQMRYCSKLQELPTSIGSLVHLLELDLQHCYYLETLPESIDNLKRLKRFELLWCVKLTRIPTGVGQLPDLQYLGLDNCHELQSMCDFESEREYFYHLSISYCLNLASNFKSLGNLHRLRTLLLRSCSMLMIEDLSRSLRKLSQLQKLDLWDCHKLVPEEAAKWDLVTSNLSFCKCLVELRLPAISQAGLPALPLLKILWLENGLHLEELPTSLGDLIWLEKLRLDDNNPLCWKFPQTLLELPESLGQWSQLKKLEILGLGSKNLEGLGKLFGLQNLELIRCHELESLPECINQLFQLRSLELNYCKKLKQLPESLGQLFRLKRLWVIFCNNLKRLPESLVKLNQLSELHLSGCHNLALTEVGQQSLLRNLESRGCYITRPTEDDSEKESDTLEELEGDNSEEEDSRGLK